MTTSWHCEQAWLRSGIERDVLVVAADDGTISSVLANAPTPADGVRLNGVVLPGFANAHSHAFHRALRGRTHGGGGSFWTWREQMYALSAVLDPSAMHALARAVYAEMVLAGISAVGEFHYLHHGPAGRPYSEPHAMEEALREAASDAGIRLTLLDACYLTGGIGEPLSDPQRRFADADADAWAARVQDLAGRWSGDGQVRVGVAAHSVRAVPEEALATVRQALPDAPLHVHLSEQPAENEQSQAAYGCTPTALLDRHGLLSAATTAVHATHLTAGDVSALGGSGTSICLCPTTERDLADGIGPGRALVEAGSPVCLGSDQQVVIDLFEEARGIEAHERLSTNERGQFDPTELVAAMTGQGHAALGWPEAGAIAVGAPADLVAIDLDSVRTAGSDPGQIVFSATSGDVTDVVVSGRQRVAGGSHTSLGEVGALLSVEIARLWDKVDR